MKKMFKKLKDFCKNTVNRLRVGGPPIVEKVASTTTTLLETAWKFVVRPVFMMFALCIACCIEMFALSIACCIELGILCILAVAIVINPIGCLAFALVIGSLMGVLSLALSCAMTRHEYRR